MWPPILKLVTDLNSTGSLLLSITIKKVQDELSTRFLLDVWYGEVIFKVLAPLDF